MGQEALSGVPALGVRIAIRPRHGGCPVSGIGTFGWASRRRSTLGGPTPEGIEVVRHGAPARGPRRADQTIPSFSSAQSSDSSRPRVPT